MGTDIALQKKIQKAIAFKLDGENKKAVAVLEGLLVDRPYHLTILSSLAELYTVEFKYALAVEMYKKMLMVLDEDDDCDQVGIISINIATNLHTLALYSEAEQYFNLAQKLLPDNLNVLERKANFLVDIGRVDDAKILYETVLNVDRRNIGAICGIANILVSKREFLSAVAEFKRALSIAPNQPNILFGLVNTYMKAKEYDLAVQVGLKALAANPQFVALLLSLSSIYLHQKQLSLALDYCNKALEINPSTLLSWNMKAHILSQMHRFDEADECYEQAALLATPPDDVIYKKSLQQLLLGKFDIGWEKHEARLNLYALKRLAPLQVQNATRWHHSCALKPDETLLVYSEQGLGDTLQFVRFIPWLVEQGINVILYVQPALRSILRTVPILNDCIVDEIEGEINYFVPLMSLPYEFKMTVESIPTALKFGLPEEKSQKWRKRLSESSTSKKIGLVSTGNIQHLNDYNRSISLEALLPYLPPQHQYFILQKDIRPEDQAILDSTQTKINIEFLGNELEDFIDTACACENLDLLITVDTSVAHLAGSLDIPCWVMLSFTPDWRWLLQSDDTHWYPNMRLFRQSEYGEWFEVFAKVHRLLVNL